MPRSKLRRTKSEPEEELVEELILYSPHKAQKQFHEMQARYRVCSWGRQSGKSTGALNDILKKAWERPSSTIWFISPTYDQATVQYRRLVGMLWPVNEIMLKKNQSELRIKLANQSQIVFKSGQNFEALRSETLHGCVIDEVRDQDPSLWPMIIRPMLTTTKGWCAFISTPNGFDAFYDLAKHAELDDTGTWAFMKAPSTCNPLISQAEVDDMKKTMTDKQYMQEVMAEFVDLTSGKAYYNFSTANITQVNPFAKEGEILSPHIPIAVAMDFNVNPIAWTLGQEHTKKFYWYDEIVVNDSNTEEAAKILAIKAKGHKAGVLIVGDASGKARSTASAGQTDYDIIAQILRREEIPFQIQTPDSNPLVKDRVNTFNFHLKNPDGNRSMWMHPRCKALIKDCERVSLKVSTTDIFALDKSRDPSLTHSSDGVGYYLFARASISFKDRPASLRVIRR